MRTCQITYDNDYIEYVHGTFPEAMKMTIPYSKEYK